MPSWNCLQKGCARNDIGAAIQANRSLVGVVVRRNGQYFCADCNIPATLPAGVSASLLPPETLDNFPQTPPG